MNFTHLTDFSAFKIISERNIFDPNRRPHIIAGAAHTIVDSFSLTGTMFYGKGHFAVFDGTSSDYRKVLEPGGTIAGYAVAEIGLDSVKLSSGTNQLDVSVGRQLRRNVDGQWSVGDQPESSRTSYASASTRRNGFQRQSGSARPTVNSENESPATSALSGPAPDVPDATDASLGPGPGSEPDTTNAPPETTSADPNDPVARMMQRRAQELNGNNPNQ